MTGDAPAQISQVAITSVGNWRGEGMALIEKIEETDNGGQAI